MLKTLNWGLEKAEKSPDKGFKGYPKFEKPQELPDSEEETQEDEVVLLEGISDKTSKHGENKVCQSSKDKKPHEYQCRDLKIPKKSSQNDGHTNHTSLNGSHEKRTSSKYHEDSSSVDPWGFESAFGDDKSTTLKTKQTRSFKNKYSSSNIQRMVHRQDGPMKGILGMTGRNKTCTRRALGLNKEAFVAKIKRTREEPFDKEINQVMRRSKSTVDDKKNLPMSKYKDRKPVIIDLKDGCYNWESSSCDEGNVSQPALIVDLKDDYNWDSSSCDEVHARKLASSIDTKIQYFENIGQKNSLELDVSSDSEQDFQENPTAESKVCNNDDDETSKKICQQSTVINFPSYAATPRHSIHDDDKSNAKSFYGAPLKTYSRKSRIKNNKIGERIDNNQEVKVSTSDDKESSVDNAKKRKLTNNRNLKKNQKNDNSNNVKQRKKHKAEPEFFLISSSDEEDDQSGLEDGNTSGTESTSKTKPKKDSATMTENSVTAENGQATSACKTAGTLDNPFERDSFTTEILLGPKCMLGKLKGTVDGALEITAHQLKWRMKYMDENGKPVEQVILILADDLTAFMIHVDNDPKIIVLRVNQRCTLKLRGKIKGLDKFFNPCSAVVEEQEIALQVDDVVSNETLADITEWVKDRLGKTFTYLSTEEAQHFYDRLNSSDLTSKSGDIKQIPRYNTRSNSKSAARSTVTPTKMIIYPFPPTPGGITVTSADMECLAEGEYLNDVIIDFYLKYIYHDKLSEDDKKRTHIFSSFFYKRLTQKNPSNNEFFESAHDRMHSQVKTWTRNVDIFSKDFVIVPINESSHWYLAIICFPNLDEPIIEETIPEEESEATVIEDSEDFVEKQKTKVNVDEKADDDDDTDLETSALAIVAKKTTTSKKSVPKNKPILKANPCILIFDSLANTGRSRVFSNLRHYLSREWKAKRPHQPAREFLHQKGSYPKVPEQDNHCDCGIFVLQYVESFFEDPIRDYRVPIHKTNWFTHSGISGKRQEIKDLILRLKEKYTSSSR